MYLVENSMSFAFVKKPNTILKLLSFVTVPIVGKPEAVRIEWAMIRGMMFCDSMDSFASMG
jgi:hypothetical protein